MKISILIPLFNEEDNIRYVYEGLTNLRQQLEHQFEFLFIDDGSIDGSLELLLKLRSTDSRVEIISLSRNFGSHAAVYTGFQECSGDAAVVLSADCQDPPELVGRLVSEIEMGRHVVWGQRATRGEEPLFLSITSRCYYLLLKTITCVQLPSLGVDVVMLSRKAINTLNKINQTDAPYTLLIAWMGFPSAWVKYDKVERRVGRSKWTLGRRVKLFIDSMTIFSYIPIRLMSALGVITALVGVSFCFFTLLRSYWGYPIAGWASLMVVVLVIGGVQLLMLGVIGEYLWRSADASRGWPRSVVQFTTIGNRSQGG